MNQRRPKIEVLRVTWFAMLTAVWLYAYLMFMLHPQIGSALNRNVSLAIAMYATGDCYLKIATIVRALSSRKVPFGKVKVSPVVAAGLPLLFVAAEASVFFLVRMRPHDFAELQRQSIFIFVAAAVIETLSTLLIRLRHIPGWARAIQANTADKGLQARWFISNIMCFTAAIVTAVCALGLRLIEIPIARVMPLFVIATMLLLVVWPRSPIDAKF